MPLLRSYIVLSLLLCLGVMAAAQQTQTNDLSKLDLATLQQRADSGDAAAQSELGDRYRLGRGVPQDQVQALTLINRAVEQGNAHAEFILAGWYAAGTREVPKNPALAALLIRKAAVHGYAQAQTEVASMFNDGHGVCQDFAQAALWYRGAAEQGDAWAQWNLGNAYDFGRGVPRDLVQARNWYQKAVENHLATSAARSRLERLDSVSLASGADRAASVMEKPSAQQPGACAQGALAERNLAEFGNPIAQLAVGQQFEDEGQYAEALKWYTRVAIFWGPNNSVGYQRLLRIAVRLYNPTDDGAEIASRLGAPSSRFGTTPVDYRTITPADTLKLLLNADSVKLDPKGTSYPRTVEEARGGGDGKLWKRDSLWWKACNGTNSRDSYVNDTRGEQACFQVAELYSREAFTEPSNRANFQFEMSALVRGCGLYAPTRDKADRGQTCGLLGMALYRIGNIDAAKAVWELAPGCYSYNERSGTPVNGCTEVMKDGDYFFGGASGATPYSVAEDAFTFEPLRLVRLMWKSCGTVHDRESCTFLQQLGAHVDMAAVDEAENKESQGLEENRAAKTVRLEQAQAAAEARRNAIFGALQSMPGASDPNAIVSAGNQQAAQVRAIGDANASAQQQATQARIATQQQMAQQGAATLQAQQQANQANYSSGGNASGGNGASYGGGGAGTVGGSEAGYTTPPEQGCISQFWDPKYYNWLSFQNNCGQAINLTWIAKSPSDTFGTSSANLASGQSTNSGWSQSEVAQKQNFAFFICSPGSFPVDSSTHQGIRSPNETFVCQKQ